MDKKLFRTGPYADFFSQGVQVGNVLTLAGQLGDTEDGSVPVEIKDQMINCYTNIKNVLSEKVLSETSETMLKEAINEVKSSMLAA